MKQINVKLLAILFVSTLFTVVGSFFLYRFQKQRNADGLLVRAAAKEEAGEYSEAIKLMGRYLALRKDDKEQYVKFAMTMMTNSENLFAEGRLNGKTFQSTMGAVEAAIRKNPEHLELREKAIDFTMKFSRMTDAMNHLKFMMEKKPEPKWMVKLAECLAKSGQHEKALPVLAPVVGFDPETRQFVSSAADADEDAYALLASVYMFKFSDIETGNRVINRLVQAKPDSHQARLLRASYYRNMRRPEFNDLITADLDRAMQLAPDEFSVVVSSVENALFLRDLDKSRRLAELCIQKFPDRVEGYKAAANWALFDKNTQTAINYLNRGLEKKPGDSSLLWMRANIELDRKEFEKLEETREELVAAKYPISLLKFLDSRREFAAENWLAASKKLEEVRPEIEQRKPQWISSLDSSLEQCYERMGQHDKRLKPLQRILDANPDNIQARWSKIQALLALNQHDKLVREYEVIKQQMKGKDIKMTPQLLIAGLQIELLQQEKLAKSRRNYKNADAYAKQIMSLGLHRNGATARLIETLLSESGRTKEAEQFRKDVEKNSPNDLAVIVGRINEAAKTDGIEAAIGLLEENQDRFTDQLSYRLLRCELLARHLPEKAKQELQFLEADMETFPTNRQISMVRGMGRINLLMGENKETRRLWNKLADQRPNDISVRLSMFELAMDDGDDEGMLQAQKRIAELVGEESAEWQFAEAARLSWRGRNGHDVPPRYDDALGLVEQAISRRESWEMLYRLKGELQLLRGRNRAAIDALKKTLELGVAHPNVYRQLARLYFEEGNNEQAERMLRNLPKSAWSEQERRIEMDILASKGQLPEDLPYDSDSADPAHHIWIAKLMSNAGRFDEANAAFDRGLELNPESQENWLSKVQMFVMAGDEEKAKEVMAAAELKLPEKDTASFLGKCYAHLREWDNAATYFEDAYNQDPDNEYAVQALAETMMKLKEKDRANELLDKLLEDATPNDAVTPVVAWARRAKARILASAGSYHEFTQALKLIEDNALKDGAMAPDDMVLWARLSAVRPDGFSRQQAIKKFEEIEDRRALTSTERRTLADLYNRQERWPECKSVMMDLLADDPKDMTLLDPWLRWLMEHDELQSARKWVKNCPPGSVPRLRTEAMLDARAGKSKRAVDRLNSLVPSNLPEKDAGRLKIVAAILEQMGEYDERIYSVSERVWRRYLKFRPRDSLSFAAYLGRRGGEKRVAEALQLCGRALQEGEYESGLQLAVAILRHNHQDTPKFQKFISVVRGWFETAMKARPDKASFFIQRSQFEDVAGNSEEAKQWLREYLDGDAPISPMQRAIVANNLAYMLALGGENEESYKLCQEAMKVLGPTSDLRDTLGVIYLSQKQTQNAIREFEAAIGDGGVTSFKYVHLAMAHEQAGDHESSAKTLLRAFDMGLQLSQFSTLEKSRYDQLVAALIEKGAVTQEELNAALPKQEFSEIGS